MGGGGGGEDRTVAAEASGEGTGGIAGGMDEGAERRGGRGLGEGTVESAGENQTAAAAGCWPVAAVAAQRPLQLHIHELGDPLAIDE